MKHHPTLDIIAIVLLIVGGLNLGIEGLTNFNVIREIFQGFANVIFMVIGFAAAYRIVLWAKVKSGK